MSKTGKFQLTPLVSVLDGAYAVGTKHFEINNGSTALSGYTTFVHREKWMFRIIRCLTMGQPSYMFSCNI